MSAASRVLVTGATGFAGSHLARALVTQGHRVRVLVRRPDAVPAVLRGRVEVAQGDIRDRAAVEQAVAGCQLVYHLAALYRDASAQRQAYWDVNVGGTAHVLSACRTHGVERLVYCSTIGVHGSVTRIPSDETAPFHPGDAYQRSKWAAERRMAEESPKRQPEIVIIRPAGIYGPGDLRFLKLFRSIQRGHFVMLGSGTTWFHPVYIDDLVHGFLLAGARPEAVGDMFCITSSEYLTLNEFVGRIAHVLGVPAPRWHLPVWPFVAAGAVCEAVCVPLGIRPPLYRRRVDFFTHHRAFTSAKATRLLGYQARVDLTEGLRRTAEWYAREGYLAPWPALTRPARQPPTRHWAEQPAVEEAHR